MAHSCILLTGLPGALRPKHAQWAGAAANDCLYGIVDGTECESPDSLETHVSAADSHNGLCSQNKKIHLISLLVIHDILQSAWAPSSAFIPLSVVSPCQPAISDRIRYGHCCYGNSFMYCFMGRLVCQASLGLWSASFNYISSSFLHMALADRQVCSEYIMPLSVKLISAYAYSICLKNNVTSLTWKANEIEITFIC